MVATTAFLVEGLDIVTDTLLKGNACRFLAIGRDEVPFAGPTIHICYQIGIG